MDRKYELTDNTKTLEGGILLHQIRALRGLSTMVKKGDLGGWIENEDNLDHEGNAWVHGDARVSGFAKVRGNASVFGNAAVFGHAWVYGNCMVHENARVSGYTWVHGHAEIKGSAEVCGYSKVYGDAVVFGSARIFGHHLIGRSARIDFDCNDPRNVKKVIAETLGIGFVDGVLRMYKRVQGDLSSEYSDEFKYELKQWVEVPDAYPDIEASCATGIHGSYLGYYPSSPGMVHIALDVNEEDIITCREGKIRAKKAFVAGIVETN